jgi:hypothetical protein
LWAVAFACAASRAFALDAAPPVTSKIIAHPAIWIVHSKNATAYLLGSVHVLPSNVDWHSPKLDTAIASSDVFVFEAPLDDAGQAAGQEFIRAHGVLPPDTALPSLLDTQTLADYRKTLEITHVPPESLDHMRPWFAAIILEIDLMRAENYSPDSGVDRQIFAVAKGDGKPIRLVARRCCRSGQTRQHRHGGRPRHEEDAPGRSQRSLDGPTQAHACRAAHLFHHRRCRPLGRPAWPSLASPQGRLRSRRPVAARERTALAER